MKLNVSQALMNPGTTYAFSGEQTIAPQEVSGETISFENALLEGTYVAGEDGSVTVDGRLTVIAHGQCAKCLEPASANLESEFQETFLRDGDPEDDETFSYEGYQVEFDKLAMSYALLALPIRLLCREDCPGLPGMGCSDEDTCVCQKEEPSRHPFAALQQLLTDMSEEE